MEEGPEPQELFEQVEHRHEESEEHEENAKKKAFTMRSAITASTLAVLAALGSLLSGHAANEAILKQAEASDQWAYYQAKSTKSHIYEGDKYVVQAFAKANKISDAEIADSLKDFDKKIAKYESEKNEVQKEAQSIQRFSAEEFNKHQQYSLGVACFQIGIVLASVAILVSSSVLYFGSLGAGAIGVAFLVYGQILH
jgi:hypothetical protein